MLRGYTECEYKKIVNAAQISHLEWPVNVNQSDSMLRIDIYRVIVCADVCMVRAFECVCVRARARLRVCVFICT